MGSVTCTGLEYVESVDGYVPYNHRPARFVVIGAIASGNAAKFDVSDMSLVMTGVGTTIQHHGLKCVKASRKHSRIRMVLVDSRRNFQAKSSAQWNIRSTDGTVDATSQLTLTELWEQIAVSTGVPLEVDASVPHTIYPPSPSSEMTFSQIASEILKVSACRMVPKLDGTGFTVMSATNGSLPTVSNRVRHPREEKVPSNIRVHSGPAIYQSDVSLEAVVKDDLGAIVSLDSVATPDDYFAGFLGVAGIDRARLQNSAFRMWKITALNHADVAVPIDQVRILNAQAGTLMADRNVIGLEPEFFGDGMVWLDSFTPAGTSSKRSNVNFIGAIGNRILCTDKPIIRNDSGSLATTCSCRLAYHVTDGATKNSAVVTSPVAGGAGPDEDVYAPWVIPIQTAHAGINTTNWATELNAIATVQAQGYEQPKSVIHTHGFINPTQTGRIGGVRYRASLFPRPRIDMAIAINHTPEDVLIR